MTPIQAHMRFPDGKAKVLTLSYDDGVQQDKRLVEILDRHHIKATFNINSGLYAAEGTVYPEGQIHRRMTHTEALALYKDSGHEVAVHALTHPWLEQMPPYAVANEIISDRKNLEADFNMPIRGMAYPFGTFNDTVINVLKDCGIAYARTTIATRKFTMPTDWLRLAATCHHSDEKLIPLAETFINSEPKSAPLMFYLWGHAYEFEDRDNWNVIEEFCELLGDRDDIWYATNIEIYEYTEAFNRLVWSVDMRTVKNPTATSLTFLACEKGKSKLYTVAPGETLCNISL